MHSEDTKATAISYLTQKQAQELDAELMGPEYGFSVDQLMELAGLSVACSIEHRYPPSSHGRVLIVCGPGNNGGDGLVCARHLALFGYKCTVCYPKDTSNQLYLNLLKQCRMFDIPIVSSLTASVDSDFDIVVDAIFGFSFKGAIRPPFDTIIEGLNKCKCCRIVSIDIPSGWDVESGDTAGCGLKPSMLVSLTAPKTCASKFNGNYHYLGGRFVPRALAVKYNLTLPLYPSSTQYVDITDCTPCPSPTSSSL